MKSNDMISHSSMLFGNYGPYLNIIMTRFDPRKEGEHEFSVLSRVEITPYAQKVNTGEDRELPFSVFSRVGRSILCLLPCCLQGRVRRSDYGGGNSINLVSSAPTGHV